MAKHILLVEDNDDDAYLLEHALRRVRPDSATYRVRNGHEAIGYLSGMGEYSDRNRFPMPHVVVLDLMTPKVNGVKMLEWRQNSGLEYPSVVVWSGRPDLLSHCMQLGASGFEAKGLSLKGILHSVNRELGPSESSSQSSPLSSFA